MAKLVECIPNFSISREQDPEGFEKLVQMGLTLPGCSLFDYQSDGNHNRSVFTLIGSPEGIEEAAFQLTKLAAGLIDMREHKGQHPRMGATDVMPFVPQQDVSLEECIDMSRRVAARIWDELHIPSFLYEDSATRPERKNLAEVRRGEFEGMPEKLLDPDWAPDYGERKIHPTAGIMAIGARMPLVAFNINLDTDDLQIAKDIAKKVRESSGGLPFVKAIGILLEDKGVAQVSMNMVNYYRTPLYRAFDRVKELAAEQGVGILGSEIVGLTPARALTDSAEYYLQVKDFEPYDQVIEYHLLDMM